MTECSCGFEFHFNHIIFLPKTVEKYLSFSIKEAKEVITDRWIPLVFIGQVFNYSLDILVRILGENNYHYISQVLA